MRFFLYAIAALVLFTGSAAAQQPITVRVVKVEKLSGDVLEGASGAWFTFNLVMRSSEGTVYHIHSKCVLTTRDIQISCANLTVPHAGREYRVRLYTSAIGFSDDNLLYEIDSEEAQVCK
jgi:hypothetical protein